MTLKNGMRPVHPGEILRDELQALGMSANALSKALGVPVWFRIASEAVRRMKEQTPGARGDRLVDALFAWLTPDRQLAPDLNRFQVLVSDDGDTRIERYGD